MVPELRTAFRGIVADIDARADDDGRLEQIPEADIDAVAGVPMAQASGALEAVLIMPDCELPFRVSARPIQLCSMPARQRYAKGR